jgi:hypothetical protein
MRRAPRLSLDACLTIHRVIIAYATLAGAIGSVFWAFFIWLDSCCFWYSNGSTPLVLLASFAIVHVLVRRDGPVPALDRVTRVAVVSCAVICGLILLWGKSMGIG